MGLVTIEKAHVASELLVLKSKLESEGVICYLRNEYTTQIMNYLPSFEVELQVSELDLEKVREIMTRKDAE
ncbi:putative signal transducing protein [Lutimonas sp.]|jgi:hypothetical protein|uniref:putative signal transducing protein n=1 Tax=Lutimonas sp. TaxID=1872403 RepID=UPI003C722467